MGKPLVWGPWASRESLLQVSSSYYHLKREPGGGWYAKERAGVEWCWWWQRITVGTLEKITTRMWTHC